jgi:hypothetical protein
MQPDRAVAHEAKVNPKLVNKTFRLEPKKNQEPLNQGFDVTTTAKEFLER